MEGALQRSSMLLPLYHHGTAGLHFQSRTLPPMNHAWHVSLLLSNTSVPNIDTAFEDSQWYDPRATSTGIYNYCTSSSRAYERCIDELFVTTKLPPWVFGDKAKTDDILDNEYERFVNRWYQDDDFYHDDYIDLSDSANTCGLPGIDEVRCDPPPA